ncbi:hypothetical protein, partial [Paracraurococcus lichenis]|nr:hypothetical protein [Paracraurococcus sp. LOR1-02]
TSSRRRCTGPCSGEAQHRMRCERRHGLPSSFSGSTAHGCARFGVVENHSREVLKTLDDRRRKPRIAEPKHNGFSRWHGDDAARRAVVNNRTRLLSGVAHVAFKLPAEVVERSFALILDCDGMRRAWLRGRENLHKRYLIHVAGYNLGLIMRLLTGQERLEASRPGFRPRLLRSPTRMLAWSSF